MKGSLTQQMEKSADEIEQCYRLSLDDSIAEMTFALKKRGLPVDAVATCVAHLREHSHRSFEFFISEYRPSVVNLATRVERLEGLLDELERLAEMTDEETWAHVQEPYYRLQCGLNVYVRSRVHTRPDIAANELAGAVKQS